MNSQPDDAVVSVQDIKRKFGSNEVLRGTSLDVKKGDRRSSHWPVRVRQVDRPAPHQRTPPVDASEAYADGHAVHNVHTVKQTIRVAQGRVDDVPAVRSVSADDGSGKCDAGTGYCS
jgi:hypothetical protein